MQRRKMRRDWSSLPEEIISIICDKASTTNRMYVRLRSVYTAWRRALPPRTRQLPWLLIPQNPRESRNRVGRDNSRVLFYSPSQSKTHQFKLPFLRGKRIYGSSYGWLLLKHDYSVWLLTVAEPPLPTVPPKFESWLRPWLLNPITGTIIDFPPLNKVSNGSSSLPRSEHPRQHCTQKVMLTCCPSQPDCIVVACAAAMTPNWELVFCRIGDTQWTGLKPRVLRKRLLDFTVRKNSVYTVNNKKEVSVSNLETLATWTYPSHIKYCPARDRINLVADGESDEPLVINTPEYLGYGKKDKFHVFKYIDNKWCRVMDIGKWKLFLARDNCTILPFEEEKGNKLYYNRMLTSTNHSYHIGIGQVNLKTDNNVTLQTSPLEVNPDAIGSSRWFTPCLD
ncbi:hypothetical protein LUZ61_013381 [Rhynchospora tenuis]|uniref:KIB1-4 beta-propeller domain-containing protein n=1 Tax=Rhynchospora tenuis TaxID=198213 RepID=A0AAD5Z1P2_9POAL|nr:hypothetical protein LUZ61_013381 [Rhynchospora tenuis]